MEFRRGEGTYEHAAFSSSYGALYYPWLEISDPVSGNKKLVPPSGAVAGCYARSDQKNLRLVCPGRDRPRPDFQRALSGLQDQPRRARRALPPRAVNVIAVFPDSGVTIWGPAHAAEPSPRPWTASTSGA